MATGQKSSSSKASKPIGNRAKTSSQPSNGNLSTLRGPLTFAAHAAPGNSQPAQPAVPTSMLAIYIYEHDDHSLGKFCVFAGENQVFVIPSPAVPNNLISTLAKGLSYKVFLSKNECSLKIQSLARLEHLLLSKIEIPTQDDYKSAPYFRCRVTVAKSTALHANFQLLTLGVNIQVPFDVIPDTLALKGKDEHNIRVAFTTRFIRTNRAKTPCRVPFVEPGFFNFCDILGIELPPPPPKYSMSSETIAAVKAGFRANLIVGVPDGQHYDGLAITGGDLHDWKITRSTTAKSFLGSLLSHLRSQSPSGGGPSLNQATDSRNASLLKYYEAHFSNLGRTWTTSTSTSRPTVVFFLGLSEALTVHVADALALDLHRVYGISSRIVTPAAPHSNGAIFEELNSPRVSPLSKTLFRLSEPLQLGLLDYDSTSYRYDLPELFLPHLAYDVRSDVPPSPPGSMILGSQEIFIASQPPPDADYLTDPDSLHGLYISSSDSTTRFWSTSRRLVPNTPRF